MKTFTGKYYGNNYIFSSDIEAIRIQLISILNTPLGTRFYYPGYGSRLNEFRFSVLNQFTIGMIGQEIKSAIGLIEGVELTGISYYTENNKLYFTIDLSRLSENVRLNITVTDGVAS